MAYGNPISWDTWSWLNALVQILNGTLIIKWIEPLKIPRFATSWNTSVGWNGFPFLWVIIIPSKPASSPPARWGLLDFIRVVLLLVLLQFLLTMSASTSTCTSALPILGQALCQPSSPSSLPTSQLSVHRWTSPWDLPSSVCTAGPQPGTCPAQCAPLDLNRGPAQLSVHSWTSTGDLPSSVCTQPGTFPAQCAPLDLNLGPAQLSVHRWTSTAR